MLIVSTRMDTDGVSHVTTLNLKRATFQTKLILMSTSRTEVLLKKHFNFIIVKPKLMILVSLFPLASSIRIILLRLDS